MKNTRNCPNCSLEFNIQGDWIGTCPVCNKTIAVKNNTVEVPEFKILYDPEKGPSKEFQFGTPLYYDPNTAGNTDFSFKRVLCGVALFIVDYYNIYDLGIIDGEFIDDDNDDDPASINKSVFPAFT